MPEVGDMLARMHEVSQTAEQMADRNMAATFCITTDIGDPLELRRVKVTTAAKGGNTQTDWMMRALPCPYWDPPMPTVGMSLVSENFDGNPHDGVIFGPVHNNTNPVFNKTNPALDDWRYIPGVSTLQIGGEANYSSGATWTTLVESGDSVTTVLVGDWLITATTGVCQITGPSSSIRIDGDTVTVSAASTVALVAPMGITLNGSSLDVLSGRWRIDGQEIAVIGATDDQGHDLVTSGQ